MLTRSYSNRKRRQAAGARSRGGTILEAALTLFIFFMFLFAILEFGRAYNVYQTLTNAAREGARYAVAPCPTLSTAAECSFGPGVVPDQSAITSKVQMFLDSANIKGADITVDQHVAGTINGLATEFTDVSVSAPYRFLFFPFGSINLKTQAVMRNENN